MSMLEMARGEFTSSLGFKWYLTQLTHFVFADKNEEGDSFKSTTHKILRNLQRATEHERNTLCKQRSMSNEGTQCNIEDSELERSGSVTESSNCRSSNEEALEKELLQLRMNFEMLKSQHSRQQLQTVMLEKQIMEAAATVDFLENENNDLKFQLLQKQEKIQSLMNKNQRQEWDVQDVESLQKNLSCLETDVIDLKDERDRQDERIFKLEKENDRLCDSMEDSDREIRCLKKEIMRAQNNVDRYRKNCHDWRFSYEELESELLVETNNKVRFEETIRKNLDSMNFMFRLFDHVFNFTREFQDVHAEYILQIEESLQISNELFGLAQTSTVFDNVPVESEGEVGPVSPLPKDQELVE